MHIHTRATRQLQRMTGQAKASDIGHGMYAVYRCQLRAGRVQARRCGDHLRIALRRQLFFFQSGRQHTHAQRFAQHQHVTCLRRRIAFDAAWVRQAQHHQTVNRFHRIDAVAACDRNACGLTHALSTGQYLANGVCAQHTDGHADQRQSKNRRTSHGVHIADGIGRGDASEVKRIVDDRHEEIGGCDQGLVLVEQIHRRVVRGVDAHQQSGWQRKAFHVGEDVAQHAGRDLAATSATVGQCSQSGWCVVK